MPNHSRASLEELLPEPTSSSQGRGLHSAYVGKSTVWSVLRGLSIALLTITWALVAHFTSSGKESSGWGAALALIPLCAALALALGRMPQRWLKPLTVAAVAVGLAWFWPFLKAQVALLYFVEHLGVYTFLSAFFGRTLLGPGESLVTRMARSVHGGVLSPAQIVYTRQVTLAWCVFFAGMALVSTLLFLFAPVVAWSTFANLLGGPLIALMFVGEYVWRRRSFPHDKPASITAAVRAWKTLHKTGTPGP